MIVNVKSEYDFLKSICKTTDIVNYAVKHNLDSIGICEVNNTFASFSFYNQCISNNIKPIIGVEIVYEGQVFLVYAKNNNGFKRINELVSAEVITFDEIEEDIIIILEKGQLIDELIKSRDEQIIYDKLNFINKDDIYIGVISYLNDNQSYYVYEICQEKKLAYIYIDQVRYLDKDDFKAYLCLRAIEKQVSINSLSEVKYKRHFVEKFNNKDNIYYENFTSKIDLKLDLIHARLLKYSEEDSKHKLRNLSLKGLHKRGFSNNKIYMDRLNYELGVIDKLGYNDYFLIVWDIIVYAHKQKILVGPGRGSAAASLVSYVLGITQIDPVAEDLLFERFLNPKRSTMPDIDIDFEDNKREEIVSYIIKRFNNAAKIATISRLQAKSAFRDVAKANNWKPNAIKVISSELNSSYSFEENILNNKKLSREYQKDVSFRTLSDYVMRIENLARQVSIHAAGVIVSDKPLANFAVVRDNVIYQESKILEQIGLLKIDILALSNLTFLNNVVKRINKVYDPITLANIALDDKASYDILSSGKTLGIFQLESSGIRSVLTRLKPSDFAQLANILALYRPGPMQYIDKYLENMKTFKATDEVGKILEISYGIIIYQEQIMQISQVVANYTLAEADILRRAISKKDETLLLSTKQDFINKSVQNGYDITYAESLFADIMKFADYGFNKAHAYSYARIAYYMAYLKAHYPSIFISEVFKHHFNSDKRDDFLIELKTLNLNILPPNILTSDVHVAALKKGIILGLTNITGISEKIANQIIANRANIEDRENFLHVVDKIFYNISLNKIQVDNLVSSGAFDKFKMNRATLRFNLENIIIKQAFTMLKVSDIMIFEQEENKFEEEARLEYNAIKINLIYDTYDLEYQRYKLKYPNLISIDRAYSLYELSRNNYTKYSVLLKLEQIKQITTKTNKQMAFLSVSSQATYDVTVFNNIFEKISTKLEANVNKYIIAQVSFNNDKIIMQDVI